MLETEDSYPYITGMGYRKMCDYVYDEFYKFDIHRIIQFDNMKIFVKTDFLSEFEFRILPKINKNFILFTHNSDLSIDSKYLNILNNIYLVKWFGQNINIINPKLYSIPIGIANRRWSHGDVSVLEKIISEKNKKDNLVYCNIDVKTNLNERERCLSCIYPIVNSDRVGFEEYLRNISKSFFVISPNGNGVDCHKTWESFYLRSVPIVTRSINMEYYDKYPFIIIDKWEDFYKLKLSEDLYYEKINNFNYESVNNGFIC